MESYINIGTSDFKIVSQSDYYIDKTKLLLDLIKRVDSGSSIIFNRPRRFGKSLTISMIETFFSRDVADAAKYFNGLYISSAGVDGFMSQYPVIRLSFADIIDAGHFDIKVYLRHMVADQYVRYQKDVAMLDLQEKEKRVYQEIVDEQADDIAFFQAMKKLSEYLHLAYGKKPLVLIDEYDAILEKHGKEDEEGIAFFKAILTSLLKDNEHLGMGILTGVFSLAKGSLGSGLNNIPVDNGISCVLDDNYFGFSEDEVALLLSRYHIDNKRIVELRDYYGGYRFNGGDYFNPWSIVSFLSSGIITGYWIDSARKSAFDSLLDFATSGDKDLVDRLIEGRAIVGKFDFTISYEDMGKSVENTLLYLAMAGYLTIRQIGFDEFELSVPNKETLSMFARLYLSHYKDQNGLMKARMMRDAIKSGDSEALSKLLRDFILSSMSYYDFSSEKNYQIMMGTIAGILLEDCLTKFEVNAGKGRSDLLISPYKNGGFGAVIEIKHYEVRKSSTRLLAGAHTALKQIKDNDYLQELFARDAKPIYAYGIAFCKNDVKIVCECIRE